MSPRQRPPVADAVQHQRARQHDGAHAARQHRIALLTPDSPDPDARADANNSALMAALAEAQRAPREGRTLAEIEASDPPAPEEEAEAAALLEQWRAQDARAGEAKPRRQEPEAHVGMRDFAGKAVSAPGRPTGRRSDPEGELSGRLVVRFPKSVHRELAQRAVAEGVSLNQLILAYVSRGLGQDAGSAR